MQEFLFTCLVSVRLSAYNEKISGEMFITSKWKSTSFLFDTLIYYSNLSGWLQNQQKDRYRCFHVGELKKRNEQCWCACIVIRCLYCRILRMKIRMAKCTFLTRIRFQACTNKSKSFLSFSSFIHRTATSVTAYHCDSERFRVYKSQY
jgi:hypothetical protein